MKPQIASIKLTTFHTDVYEPSDDSFALVDAIAAGSAVWGDRPPRICLELGSGSGYVAASVALLLRSAGAGAAVLATDVNPTAAAVTLQTARAHQVGRLDAVQCDLAGPLLPRLEGAVDLLVFNPPYVPTPDEDVGGTTLSAAWAGGYDGRVVIDRTLPLIPRLLSPTGQGYMVTVQDNEPEEVMGELRAVGLGARIALTRGADEEALRILHFWRAGAPGAPPWAEGQGSCGGGQNGGGPPV